MKITTIINKFLEMKSRAIFDPTNAVGEVLWRIQMGTKLESIVIVHVFVPKSKAEVKPHPVKKFGLLGVDS